jgi:hypothetical protein
MHFSGPNKSNPKKGNFKNPRNNFQAKKNGPPQNKGGNQPNKQQLMKQIFQLTKAVKDMGK